jgi:hypothetical protein
MTIPNPAPEPVDEATPGPWNIVKYGDGDSLVICAGEGPDWRICFMATPGSSPKAWPRIKADARLIAAAPELRDALMELLAVHLTHAGDDNWSRLDDDARTKGLALLDKLGGGQ